jgi:hypothetical protein
LDRRLHRHLGSLLCLCSGRLSDLRGFDGHGGDGLRGARCGGIPFSRSPLAQELGGLTVLCVWILIHGRRVSVREPHIVENGST